MDNKVSIHISTHNIHGFQSNSHYVKARCDKLSNSILCVQEHWLRPAYKNLKGMNQVRVVHPDFDGYGVSAMKKVHNEGIARGRPFGGTAFVFNKKFAPFLRPVVKYENERVSVMELLDIDGSILIINAYFPFRQNGDEHKVQYMEVLGLIKEIINSNPTSKFIILGDFNYNMYDSQSDISQLLRDFIHEYDLCSSHDTDPNFIPGSSYTRSCITSGSFSLLDYIFFSRSLLERVSDSKILYDGENPSDHIPVQLKLEVVPHHACEGGKPNGPASGKIIWSALNDDDLGTYENLMSELLDTIQVPSDILHGDHCCFDSSHCSTLEKYFQSLLDVVALAESTLPRKSPNGKGGKGFWTHALTQLKTSSVDSHRDWQIAG